MSRKDHKAYNENPSTKGKIMKRKHYDLSDFVLDASVFSLMVGLNTIICTIWIVARDKRMLSKA